MKLLQIIFLIALVVFLFWLGFKQADKQLVVRCNRYWTDKSLCKTK